MKQELDLNTWKRKDHFRFFSAFEEPFFGVVIRVDVTHAYHVSRENGYPFFLYYLHAALTAANRIEAFRYRIDGEQVWLYDTVHPSPTINRPDGTFGFAYMDYRESFEDFRPEAEKEVTRVRESTGLFGSASGENVVHCSSLPWLDFTSLSHARSFSFRDSCPKISFGKMTETEGRRSMPVSIHVNHALADGNDVGLFAEAFQEILNR